MIDLKDLNAIYDPSAGDEGPKPKTSPARKDPVDLGTLGETPSPIQFGTISNVAVPEYSNYLESGVYENRDIDIVRGEKQTVAQKIGLRLANFVPNVLSSAVEMIGYTGALATEWGDHRDYSNAFTEAAKQMKNPFGETYRRSNDVFALGDPTWWIDNVMNLAEIAVPFAGEAKLASAGMSAIAKGASEMLSLGQAGSRVAQGAAQLATAGFTTYTEAAMDGASVYDQTYQYQFKQQLAKGLDPEAAHTEAQHLAAQSAATTVQLSTAMTTLLNLSSVAPFFKESEDVTRDVLRNSLTRLPGEEAGAWANRIKNLAAEDFPQILGKHGARKFMQEMGQEGIEEVEQQFAQQTGTDEGRAGNTHGFLDQLNQFQSFFDRTLNAQGALAFVLGAAGGGLQTAIIENARVRKSNINEHGEYLPQAVNADGTLKWDQSGKPVMQSVRVSPRTYDEWSTKKVFNDARDLVAEDVSNFAKMQGDYLAAVKKNDPVAIEKARNDMFNVSQMNAVTSGMTDPWVNTFQEISQLDNTQSLNPEDENGPTQAMQRGYAADRNDSEYKAKAVEAADDLKRYDEEYKKLQERYGTTYEANEGIKDLVNMMFFRKVDLMTNEKLIKRHEEELGRMEKEENDLVSAGDPESFNESIHKYNQEINSAKEVHRQLKQDHDALEKAVTDKKYDKIAPLLRKYRAVGSNSTDLQGAVDDLSMKITRQMELQSNKVKTAEDAMLATSGYQLWKESNPDGTFKDYRELIQKKYSINKSIPVYRTSIEAFKARHNIAQQNYADIHREESIGKFVKKATDWRNQMQKQADDLRQKQSIEISKTAKDKATAARLEAINTDGVAERYRVLRDKAVSELESKKTDLKNAEQEIDGVSAIKDPLKYFALKSRIFKLRNEIKTLNKQIKAYESAISDYAVDISSPAGDVPTGGIVDEGNDLEKEEEQVDTLPVPDLSTALPVDETEDVSEDIPSELQIDSDPYKEFQEDIAYLPKIVQSRLAEIEEGWRTGELGFSLNLLNQQVKDKKIGIGKAATLLQQLWEIVEDDMVPQDILTEVPVVTSEVPEQKVDTIAIPKPLDPIIDNTDEDFGTTLAMDDLTHAEDDKTVNVLSIANSTLEWRHDLIGKTYKKFGTTNLDPKSNPEILSPTKLLANTKIKLVVDTDYDGTSNITGMLAQEDTNERSQKKDKFSDYTNSDGTIKSDDTSIGNVPIKITDENGKTIGYIRKLDWVLDKYPGTDNYNNIAQFIYDEDGNAIDNVKLQREAILSLRRKIVDQWQGTKTPVDAKVLNKGTGHLIYNYKEARTFGTKPKLVQGYARAEKEENSLLPDKKIQIGIVDKDTINVGSKFAFPGQKGYDASKFKPGNVVALLPSANGKFLAVPLTGIKLDQRKTNIQTAVRVIELYMLHDGTNKVVLDEIEQIRVNTGHDIVTEFGLRNFLSQYITYTQSFKDTDVAANAPSNGQRREQFLFNISDKAPGSTKAEIKLGWSFSGKPILKAAIVNGTLDPAFVEALLQGFGTRSKQVNYTDENRGIKGINSTGEFTEAFRTASGWRFSKHDNYNEYVKSWSKTTVYGKNKANGQYVYTANPQMPFEIVETKNPVKTKIVANTSPTEVKMPAPDLSTALPVEDQPVTSKPEVKVDTTKADMFDDLFNASPDFRSQEVQELGTAPDNVKPLTVQNLDNIYSTVPENQRNGKTVQEIYNELVSRGHTFIPEGYNPFSLCM